MLTSTRPAPLHSALALFGAVRRGASCSRWGAGNVLGFRRYWKRRIRSACNREHQGPPAAARSRCSPAFDGGIAGSNQLLEVTGCPALGRFEVAIWCALGVYLIASSIYLTSAKVISDKVVRSIDQNAAGALQFAQDGEMISSRDWQELARRAFTAPQPVQAPRIVNERGQLGTAVSYGERLPRHRNPQRRECADFVVSEIQSTIEYGVA